MLRTALTGLLLTLLLALQCTGVSALTYSERIQAGDSWKRGYVFAYADYVETFAKQTEPRSEEWLVGYRACLMGFTDQALVRTVDEYLVQNPAAKMTPAQIAEAQKLAREWKPK